MRKLLFLILILINFNNSIAQTIAFETKFKEDYKGYAAILSGENEIIAMVQGKDCDAFFLTTDNGTIERKKDDCKWSYIPHKYQISKIFFNEIVNGDTIVFHEKRLYVKPWRFIPTLGKWVPEKNKTLHLTKEELKNTRLLMESINTNLSAKCRITSFEVHITRNNELLYAKKFNEASRETLEEYTKQFEHLKKDDIVEFKEIKYNYPSRAEMPFILDTYDVKILIK